MFKVQDLQKEINPQGGERGSRSRFMLIPCLGDIDVLPKHFIHWGGTTKVTRVTIVVSYCQQKHMANLSNSVLRDRGIRVLALMDKRFLK